MSWERGYENNLWLEAESGTVAMGRVGENKSQVKTGSRIRGDCGGCRHWFVLNPATPNVPSKTSTTSVCVCFF